MPSIVLYHPRTFHEKNYRHFYLPYSLLTIASMVDRSKVDITIIDNNISRVSDWSEWLGSLSEPPELVGISSMIGAQIADGLNFAEQLGQRFPDVPKVWGGALPTVLPEETVAHPAVDYAVVGQGQQPFRRIVENVLHDRPIDGIPGVHASSSAGPTLHAAEFGNWDDYPRFEMTYDLVDVEAYVRNDEHINTRTVNYHSSQGCPFGCGFCSEVALWGRRWTAVEPDHMLADIEHLVTRHGVNGIKSYDAEFFINKPRAFTFADKLKKSGLNIRWAAAVHPRNIAKLRDDELDLLAESGVSRLLMGAESGVQDELDLIRKRTDQQMLVDVARRCANRGIVGSFSFVTGYPGSPSSHVEASLEFARQLLRTGGNHEAKVHFFAPYPGTPLYPLSVQHGFVPPETLEEWAEYDYYYITTPWVDPSWERIVRDFNEDAYPYLHAGAETPPRICPIIA